MKAPILLFGMPRSGTTWLGKIFDSHPDTLYRHEPDSVRRLSLPLFPEQPVTPEQAEEIRGLVAVMPDMREAKVVGKMPLFPKSYLSAAEFAVKQSGIWSAKVFGRVRANFPVPLLPRAERAGRGRIAWKSIESLGRLGVMLDVLDSAVAIHLLRHPCGYISSVLRGEAAHAFVAKDPSSDDYGLLGMLLETGVARRYGVTLDALRGMTPEERLAWRWLLINEKAIEDAAPGGRCLAVSYESLCRDPLGVSRSMFDFTGLDWNAQTERFLRQSTASEDASYYSVYKDPLRAAMRWREELAPDAVERIMAVVARSPLAAAGLVDGGDMSESAV